MRVKCFLQTDKTLILPAFDTFTSGKLSLSADNDTLYPITGDQLFRHSLV